MENKELKRDDVRLQARLAELEREMSRMRNTINKVECLVKRNNVVIVGLENNSIQELTREVIKICEKLEVLVQEDPFDCKILSGKNGKTQLLVKFKNTDTKDKVIQRRKEKRITLEECKIGSKKGNIFINEDLPENIRRLYHKARKLKKNGYKFVWYKNEQIFARKSDKTEAKNIFSENHVELMMQELQ
ncbi:hypothetical protein WA026_019461 [Henosepilachna vigintioctopunctata]|uniref:FP protein C-terminal domain-containing protein n=1 Tax=Henosepilachna vigintioctopunctata TaxID=420089 RepID=A0AAW1U1T6_9CUCU